ncbi:DUF1517 domain-containing protein [Candidatus Atelocyanobacterium thalassae]|uniref:DUF1517 domain-containing protein n=2 Tax=Candidatus Atelocyanobacterium thalassae TaxID=713887 RepID=A0A086CH64_9CHRO|nr:DUF1517 domain-containing protein [Candidatus Atelocyanobacterium thalassa]KFF41528.1 MAG: Protein of unknown function (DUF1517) [Candidatus Atelocyanobacterium thalassa isolate SIO64986]BDA39555.1 hypothetical protein CPARK_000039400 [cyanobacterium endosymbiont of Braarudosphaera bigelowii]
MNFFRDQVNSFTGKTRFLVSRIFLHLSGEDIAPLLGILNEEARVAVEQEGDLLIMGEGLVRICQYLLQLSFNWQSSANEGDIFWEEDTAGDYFNELFTDSGQRYLSNEDLESDTEKEESTLVLPANRNLVIMITIACTGEVPDLETNLADKEALEYGLKALLNLHYQERLEALQIHYSPAHFGDELTNDQLLLNFPELVPL